jgi:hypothetical protein
MKRIALFGVALCLVAGGATAGEPSKGPERTQAAVRKKLEAVLKAPAGLDFGERKQVPAREVLDQLRERHHLSMRLDLPTFASLFGPESNSSQKQRGPKTTKPASYPLPVALNAIRGRLPAVHNVPGEVQYLPSPSPVSVGPVPSPAALNAPSPIAVDPKSPPADLSVEQQPVAAGPAPTAAAAPATDQAGRAAGLPASQRAPAVAPAPAAPPKSEPEPANESESDSKPNSEDAEPKTGDADSEIPEKDTSIREILDGMEVDIETINLKEVSVATVLRHVLDAAPMVADDLGLPIPMTNAMLLDYVLEDDGLLITTRMKALTTKETRVYSVKHLDDCPPEQLSKLIRQSIRPWSWRSQINDLGDQMKGTPLPPELLSSIFKSGVQLAAAEIGATVTVAEEGEKPSPEKKDDKTDEIRQAAMVGNAIVNGLVAFAHTTLSALEMFHYAEPPSGTIQTLPGKLIIRQSQAAHREIADLLEQLAEK